ncbi:expressed unknown protein [Seminavis robusta]|uniref:Uncharacterized protein n=1 Tax=Seminavis robusta TaxID=568900 RepID=A0A9N8H4M1_9STRA|nr:expressed unknown protein [Seminavis robusta]|eukprot:Sro118_g057800.1 n/a (332) ;mRNA; r:79621-80616
MGRRTESFSSRRSAHSIDGLSITGPTGNDQNSLNQASVRQNGGGSIIGGTGTQTHGIYRGNHQEAMDDSTYAFSLPGMSVDTHMIYPCSKKHKARVNKQHSQYYWAPADTSTNTIPRDKIPEDRPLQSISIHVPVPITRPPEGQKVGASSKRKATSSEKKHDGARKGGAKLQQGMHELGILHEEDEENQLAPTPVPGMNATRMGSNPRPPKKSKNPKPSKGKARNPKPPKKASKTHSDEPRPHPAASSHPNQKESTLHLDPQSSRMRLAAVLACAMGLLLLSTAGLMMALFLFGHASEDGNQAVETQPARIPVELPNSHSMVPMEIPPPDP